MRKIVTILAVLLLASPAMAAVSITITDNTDCTATISYSDDGDPCHVRAFALDITVDAGVITAVDAAMSGDCNATDKGYGIFPGSFARYIVVSGPNWADPCYSPMGYVDDLPGDTQGGIGTSGITVEMGSLFVDGNAPPVSGDLCTVTVNADCNMTVTVNAGRAGVVLEDASAVTPDLSGATGVPIVCGGCTVDPACARADICSTTYGDPDGLITFQDYVWLSNYYPVLPATQTVCADASCLRADICSTTYGDPDGLITFQDYVWLANYYPVLPATEFDCCQ